MEDDQVSVSLDEQFYEFSRYLDCKKDGATITLYLSDYWLRQAKIIDDRTVTMTDTGVVWMKYGKTELNYAEWHEYLLELCNEKELHLDEIVTALTTCGSPGSERVEVPAYKKFFDTYEPKNKLLNVEE